MSEVQTMNSKLLGLAGAAALLAAGAGAGALISGAEAQSAAKPPVILIVNTELLVAQSEAGKTIPTQANTIKSAIEKELQAEADKLKKDIENYQKGASLMSEEVRKKTEQDLAVRQQGFCGRGSKRAEQDSPRIPADHEGDPR